MISGLHDRARRRCALAEPRRPAHLPAEPHPAPAGARKETCVTRPVPPFTAETPRPSRRDALGLIAALAGAGLAPGAALASGRGPATEFSFARLIESARAAAAAPYAPAPVAAADVLERIDYDAHWRIRFREEASLTPAGLDSPIQTFHPGRYFKEPVKIHVVEGDSAREVEFTREDFDIPEDSPAMDLPHDIGVAGFRVMRPGLEPDWISFLGASYFRTDGPEAQYGLSARGIAVDSGLSKPEEFPRFTAFWIGPPEGPDDDLTVWALLDGPSLTGAYRFGLHRGREGEEGHRVEVSARLFMRQEVERLGVAPLTSMYWYSERERASIDWRPEIHDSDGLAIATGAGERIWRPLENPRGVETFSFLDDGPKGFGLIQRDRAFAHYEDDGVFYNRRPSAWIEPLGDWGAGAVQLVLIPTKDETFDNVVAYWTPATQPKAGDALAYDYALNWIERDPRPAVATVYSTRQGHGGAPGQPIPEGVGKMVIDFEGGPLDEMTDGSGIEPVVEAQGGTVLEPIAVRRVVGTRRWRLSFDFRATGEGPVALRAFLRAGDKALSETWIAEAWLVPRKG